MASRKEIDYSLYLVTDSTPAILGKRDLVSVVREAVAGGATIVQYRDKTSDTGDLVRTAKALHTVTREAGVPLVINDRVDVALAAGVEGVHIGQDDLDYGTARRLLGTDAIIGVTANNEEEALQAARDGADYLGIGTVFATPTKEDTKNIIGTAGVQQVLHLLVQEGFVEVKTVCIGGINHSNVQRVLYQTASSKKQLDGVAVVSAIMAAEDPKAAATSLSQLIRQPAPFALSSPSRKTPLTTDHIVKTLPSIIKRLADTKPICHNMTNLVVQNFAANIAIAIGASPIMSNNGLEAGDLAALGGALVINMGTTTPEIRKNHLLALAAYNAVGGPVVLDPVGAGATEQRREGVKALMKGGYFSLIKGNEGEIRTVAGATGVQQRGVDSGASQLSLEEKIALVKAAAERERNVVLMTGAVDVLSDGETTVTMRNGHELLGEVTGSGCALGTTIAAVMAVEREDGLMAALAGVLMYEIAAECAARRADVQGPGSFVPAFLDELYLVRQASLKGDGRWVEGVKVDVV